MVDAVGRAGGQRLQLQQLAEAQDRVERRAQLVAHARQEVALGAVGPLGLVLGLAHRGLGGLALGDVRGDAGHGVGPAVLVEERELE